MQNFKSPHPHFLNDQTPKYNTKPVISLPSPFAFPAWVHSLTTHLRTLVSLQAKRATEFAGPSIK